MAMSPGTVRSSTCTVPLDGRIRPETRLRIVDLPAPFGPSSAVTPAPMPKVRSETATTSPYHLATPRRAITASTPDGKPGRSLRISSVDALLAFECSVSVTTLIPGEHHRAADRDDRRHNSQRGGKRDIGADVGLAEQLANQGRNRAGRADDHRPACQIGSIAERLQDRDRQRFREHEAENDNADGDTFAA